MFDLQTEDGLEDWPPHRPPFDRHFAEGSSQIGNPSSYVSYNEPPQQAWPASRRFRCLAAIFTRADRSEDRNQPSARRIGYFCS